MPNCMPDTRQFGYAHENTVLLTHTHMRMHSCAHTHTHIQLQSSNFISFVSLAFLSIISGFFYFRGPTLSKFLVKFFRCLSFLYTCVRAYVCVYICFNLCAYICIIYKCFNQCCQHSQIIYNKLNSMEFQ